MKYIEIKQYGDCGTYTDSIWEVPNDLNIKMVEQEVKSKFGITGKLSYFGQDLSGVKPTNQDVSDHFKKLLKRYGGKELKTQTITISKD